MRLRKLSYRLSVAQYEEMPNRIEGFFSLSCVREEISLVCETKYLPEKASRREDGWRAFVVEGQLDFSLVGILSELSATLAKAEIPIFALSTYDTDYILVKENHFDRAIAALREAGHEIV